MWGECGGHFWAPADEKPYRGETTRMNGAESLARTLVAGGVDVCFTNPGTSEMHFVAALDRAEGGRRLLADGRQARGHPAPPGPRPRQWPREPAQRAQGVLRHRQRGGRARDL